ncbi:MAG: glutamate synthase, partial [Acidobacteria bacterium]
LLQEVDAVFLGVGLGGDNRLRVPGEEGPGVVGATALIERLKHDPTLRIPLATRVAVVGGGNTALDAARELAKLGALVTLVYRRGREQMKGYEHELRHALTEGVRLLTDAAPLEILRRRDGQVGALRVAATGNPAATDGVETDISADLIVVAIGQARLAEFVSRFPGVELDGQGRIAVDPATGRTGHPRVYAGGDCVNGGKEVVNAVAEGRDAARAILRHLRESSVG